MASIQVIKGLILPLSTVTWLDLTSKLLLIINKCQWGRQLESFFFFSQRGSIRPSLCDGASWKKFRIIEF